MGLMEWLGSPVLSALRARLVLLVRRVLRVSRVRLVRREHRARTGPMGRTVPMGSRARTGIRCRRRRTTRMRWCAGRTGRRTLTSRVVVRRRRVRWIHNAACTRRRRCGQDAGDVVAAVVPALPWPGWGGLPGSVVVEEGAAGAGETPVAAGSPRELPIWDELVGRLVAVVVHAASTTSARRAAAHSTHSRSYSRRCSSDNRTLGSRHNRLISALMAAAERTGPEAGRVGGMPSA